MELWANKINPKAWDDPRYFAAAPTRDQARRIFWEDLKKLVPPAWVYNIRETDLSITTKWGAELLVVGLDKAARIEGTPWDGCVIDELADCKPGIWDANIRPALSDRAGWAWLIGVPDMDAPGQVEYLDRYEMAVSGQDPEWEAFNWPSADILPPAEVESARRRMDKRLFEQEYLGKFVSVGGLAFYAFDAKVHVFSDRAKQAVVYDPALPICWALDFNVNPMCSGVIQHKNGEVRVIDEIVLPDSSTDVACTAFLERATANKWDLKNLSVYGDASGGARDSTSGTTDWVIVSNRLRNLSPCFKIPSANPSLKDTLNAVNARLLNAAGDANLFVADHCEQLVKDLRSTLWPSDMKDSHCSAWLRYFVNEEYGIGFEGLNLSGQVSYSN